MAPVLARRSPFPGMVGHGEDDVVGHGLDDFMVKICGADLLV